jgi:HEPN domain-containing protein
MAEYVEPSKEWSAWWEQSSRDLAASEILYQHGLWAQAIFHALQSIEMSLKSYTRKPDTLADMERATLADLEAATIGELEVAGKQREGHYFGKLYDEIHSWQRVGLQPFEAQLRRFDDEKWYAATRYPEGLVKGSPDRRWKKLNKWFNGFTEEEARQLLHLATQIKGVIGARLPI